MLREAFPSEKFITQDQQLGTGHAVMCAMDSLLAAHAEYVLVINGDAPLVTTAILKDFLKAASGADIAFATITLEDSGAYGRVARKNGLVQAIVEAKDFDPAIHGEASGEVNAGIYLLRLESVADLLPKLGNANKSGEYYLTDLVALGCSQSMDVRGIECGHESALLGVNSPLELAAMEETLRRQVVNNLLASGVIVHAPDLLRAAPTAIIEPGAEITAPCEIYGGSVIKSGATIESHCVIRDSSLAENVLVRSYCHLENASVGAGAQVGPYARLRPGAQLCEDAHVGNFVELKKTRLGQGSKANHLTYLGDTDVGAGVNIGAGTITCNYDGKNKYRTSIGDGAFIGSNTSLVAPVEIGRKALVGAGSVITRNVPEDELGIARERQKNLPRRKGGQ